jgi:hypothetical protein
MKYKVCTKDNSNIELKISIQCFLAFLLTITSFCAIGQNNFISKSKEPYKVISYGEKITFGTIENTANWTITNAKENIFANLSGNQINDYTFEKPGIYEISFSNNKMHNDKECNHPQFEEKMIVQVSSIKMTFDFSKIKFSEKIQTGRNCDAIFITVPVNVVMKENVPTKFNIPNVMVAGVGSEIIAKPVIQEIIVKNGIQFLKYQLSGMANKEAYLMFDFVDINNQVQTYNHPEIIN